MRVNDRMIGLNNEGHCKVWVNEDFANNHPSYPRRRLMSTRVDSRELLEGRYANHLPTSADEADMVQDVVDTVENYSEEGRFPEPFSSRIHQRGLSFADARRLLHENIVEGRIPVPDRVDLFTNRVRGYRKVTTTTQVPQTTVTHHEVRPQTVTQVVQPVTTTTQVVQPVTTTQVIQPVGTSVVQSTQGYRFNYLPPERPYQPNIFASRVGEAIIHNGRQW